MALKASNEFAGVSSFPNIEIRKNGSFYTGTDSQNEPKLQGDSVLRQVTAVPASFYQ